MTVKSKQACDLSLLKDGRWVDHPHCPQPPPNGSNPTAVDPAACAAHSRCWLMCFLFGHCPPVVGAVVSMALDDAVSVQVLWIAGCVRAQADLGPG